MTRKTTGNALICMKSHSHILTLLFCFLLTRFDFWITGFLEIAPTATVVWSSILWPSQMLRSPSKLLLIGPKAITAGEVHLWGLRYDLLAYLLGFFLYMEGISI